MFVADERRCMHMVGNRRCKRRARWTFPVTYQWDCTKGTGIEGPSVRMCVQHGNSTFDNEDQGHRVPVIDGWFGRIWNAEAKCWTVLSCVFSTKDGHLGSKAWARYRRPCASGDIQPEIDYDQARGR
jgi:hypothetical protein